MPGQPAGPSTGATTIPPNEIINHATSGDWSLFQQQPVTDTDVNVTIKCARLDTTNNGGSNLVEADLIRAIPKYPYFPTVTMTRDQFTKGALTAACIVYAESGGNPLKVGVNGANSVAPGTRDRGLFQWNEKAWPGITDAMALNPRICFLLAWRVSKGWTDFTPWHGSRGLDPTSAESQVILKEYEAMTGRAVGQGLFGIPDVRPLVDAVKNALAGTLDWTKALGRLLSKLIDPAWWKRIGVGALGLLLVVAALILIAYTAVKG